MPQYKYAGKSQRGEQIEGRLEASTPENVASLLVERGIIPIRIHQITLKDSFDKKLSKLFHLDTVSSVDLIMFCRQMYTITKAGIPLTRGIRGLAASIRHEYFREVLLDVTDRLESGMALSRAMSQHPSTFNNLFVSMISVGESSGRLDLVFKQIGFYIERDEETRKRVKSAIRYPTFVLAALAMAVAAINIYVIPAFAQLFSSFNAELPILTKILIATSHIFVNYWYLLLFVTASAILGFTLFIKTERGAYKWGGIKLRLPVVGELIDRASMARYVRSLSLMLQAGVPLAQSLQLCAAAVDNSFLAEKIMNIKNGVERGDTLFRTHQSAKMCTPLVLQMISVGEESGQVDTLLEEVAEFYEREVDYDLKTLTDRIEPLLIVTMAVFVTVLALGIFLPMWSMYDVQSGG